MANSSAISRAFRRDWVRCARHSLVPTFRAQLAYEAVLYANVHGIGGDIVEVGVWHGGLSCLMARAQQHANATNRSVWLFDTFEGMPAPTPKDDGKAFYLWELARNGTGAGKRALGGCPVEQGRWCYGSLQSVAAIMTRGGLPPDRVHYVKGKVEHTLRNASVALPSQIAVLRLDTDFYASTEVELTVLWARLAPGGWLYVDDYFDFGGCRAAVDGWLRANDWRREAERVRAFDKRRLSRTFHLRKANPYVERRPFAEASS